MTRGPRIVTDDTKAEMKKILGEIQSGAFAKEWILENKANRPTFNALTRKDKNHLIEQVGGQLRPMMSWVQRAQPIQAEAATTQTQAVGTTSDRKIEL